MDTKFETTLYKVVQGQQCQENWSANCLYFKPCVHFPDK